MEVRAPQGICRKRARLSSIALFCSVFLMCACSTDAVGVNECRDVEYARCEASVACGVIKEEEVEECKRFYRDHCLHGMKGDEVPSADEHKECIELIEDAGKAARASLGMGGAGEPDESACKIIAAPWKSDECEYLVRESSSMGGGK
jgi:hypothetical protein